MLCKCHWIALYTVHFTAFCLGGPFFPGHGVHSSTKRYQQNVSWPQFSWPTLCIVYVYFGCFSWRDTVV